MPKPWERFHPAQVQETAIAEKDPREDLSVIDDAASSFGRGVRLGSESLFGVPGDVRQMQGAIVDFILQKAGVDEGTRQNVRSVAENFSFFPKSPTTEDIRKATNPVMGRPGAPETLPGEFAQTIGEFVPAAALGPQGLIRKAATAVVPAVASELAGQAAKGTPNEQFARAGGALIGGAATIGRVGIRNAAAKRVIKSSDILSPEEIQSETRAAYKFLTDSGVTYSQSHLDDFLTRLENQLLREGWRKSDAPKAFTRLDELKSLKSDSVARQQAGPNAIANDFDTIESIRKSAGKLFGDKEEAERAAAGIISRAIDDFEKTAPFRSAGNLSQGELRTAISDARELARRNIKLRKVNDLIEEAKTAQAGYESGLRNRFSAALRRKAFRNSFSAAELEVARQISKGVSVNNLLGIIGRAGLDVGQLGNRSTLIPGGILASALTEPVSLTSAVGTVAAASVAKIAARKMTAAKVKILQRTIAAGREIQKKIRNAQDAAEVNDMLKMLSVSGEGGTVSLRGGDFAASP